MDTASIARRVLVALTHPAAVLLTAASFVLAGAADYVFCYVMTRKARADTPDDVRTVLEACTVVIAARRRSGRRGSPDSQHSP